MEIERRVGRYALFDDTYIFNFAALGITVVIGGGSSWVHDLLHPLNIIKPEHFMLEHFLINNKHYRLVHYLWLVHLCFNYLL